MKDRVERPGGRLGRFGIAVEPREVVGIGMRITFQFPLLAPRIGGCVEALRHPKHFRGDPGIFRPIGEVEDLIGGAGGINAVPAGAIHAMKSAQPVIVGERRVERGKEQAGIANGILAEHGSFGPAAVGSEGREAVRNRLEGGAHDVARFVRTIV